MEDKKSVILLGLVMALVTCGALAVLFVFLKPSGVKESEVAGASTLHFPEAGPRPTSGPMQSSADAAAPSPVQSGGPSSLGMVQKDPNVRGSINSNTLGNLSGDASKAAAKGDAAGVMGGLKDQNAADKKAEDENGRKAADFTREVMQAVVEAVHELQPGWYKEFLKNKELKKIADDYDATKDFRAFVGALAVSGDFNAMLAAKSRLTGMRSLVKSLFSDSKLAKNLDRVFADNIDDANLAKLVKQYGRKCSLPQDMVARASGGGAKAGEEPAAPQEKPKKKPAAAPRSKPTFKPLNKGGFGGGGFGQQQQPLGGGRPPNSSVKPEDISLDDIKKLQQSSGR